MYDKSKSNEPLCHPNIRFIWGYGVIRYDDENRHPDDEPIYHNYDTRNYTKELAEKRIKPFMDLKLKSLKDFISFIEFNIQIINDISKNTIEHINSPNIIELAKDFKPTQIKAAKGILDTIQTSLLFHYLRNHNGMMNYSNSSLAEFASYLTGYHSQNIRAHLSPKEIDSIKKDRENVIAVKSIIQNILGEINSDLDII